MRANASKIHLGHHNNATKPAEESAGSAYLWWDVEVTDQEKRQLDGAHQVAYGNGFLSIGTFVQTEAHIKVDIDNTDVAPSQPHQDAAKALGFGILVVPSRN